MRTILLSAIFVSGLAQAQAMPHQAPTMNMPNYSTDALSAGSYFRGSAGTPTMRRQKLAKANALRIEAAQLQAEDGGTLSAEHAAYVRKRADRILGKRGPEIGSLVDRH